MDNIDAEFHSLMDRIRTGDQDAARLLLELYGPHILRVVRRHLSEKEQSKFDSIDFVQSVWAPFFRQPDCVHSFERPQDLVAFLVSIARNKVCDEMR
jgi:DNA-directed RNA polymerase specialized sigma subunit, sigma24 homolog